jgi:hypothetical protein
MTSFHYPRPSNSWRNRILVWVALPVIAGVFVMFAAALFWPML